MIDAAEIGIPCGGTDAMLDGVLLLRRHGTDDVDGGIARHPIGVPGGEHEGVAVQIDEQIG